MTELERYLRLNESYGSPFVFHLTDRGFYSEVNNLLNAILFGLIHKRRLIVDQSRFEGQDWSRLFASTLPSAGYREPIPSEWIIDGADAPNFTTIRAEIQRRQKSITPLFLPTGQWGKPRSILRRLATVFATPRLVATTPPGLNGSYAAFHIRRGDKTEGYFDHGGNFVIEGELTSAKAYLSTLRKKAPDIRSIFVMTDDYSIVEELRVAAPDLDMETFSAPTERGYRQNDFSAKSSAEKEESLKRLLAEAQIAARSELFLGGFKSNVARYIALTHKAPERCFSLDGMKKWAPG
jgi:hypothetical protein